MEFGSNAPREAQFQADGPVNNERRRWLQLCMQGQTGLLTAFGIMAPGSTKPTPTPTPVICNPEYTVKKGDTLSAIVVSQHSTDTWQQVAVNNGIANPDLIHRGDVIQIDCPAGSVPSNTDNALLSPVPGSPESWGCVLGLAGATIAGILWIKGRITGGAKK